MYVWDPVGRHPISFFSCLVSLGSLCVLPSIRCPAARTRGRCKEPCFGNQAGILCTHGIARAVSALASGKSESERGKKNISTHETGYSMAAAQPLRSKSRKLMPGAIEQNRCPARVAVRCVIDLGPDDRATGAEVNPMYRDGVLRKYTTCTKRVHTG
jgi:hypothetical protein